jgi:hypothetical protein
LTSSKDPSHWRSTSERAAPTNPWSIFTPGMIIIHGMSD